MSETNKDFLSSIKDGWRGLILAIVIGVISFGIEQKAQLPFLDPLVIAMALGIILRAAIGESKSFSEGFIVGPAVFLPIGIVFYALINANFSKIQTIQSSHLVLLGAIILVYISVTMFLGKRLKLSRETTYLIATGSAICGASAIAITVPVVKAKSRDTSISMLSVTLAALVGVYLILPFLATLFALTSHVYGFLSGAVLQFTGFVKVAMTNIPPLSDHASKDALKAITASSMDIKGIRYLGLLLAIPLFGSLIRGKIYIPWVLIVFICVGALGTYIDVRDPSFYKNTLIPWVKPVYGISWSIALASIGLNVDIKDLMSAEGIQGIIVAFASFLAAVVVFFVGVNFI